MSGVVTPDRGTIAIDGVPHDALTVAGSMRAGIAFVRRGTQCQKTFDDAASNT